MLLGSVQGLHMSRRVLGSSVTGSLYVWRLTDMVHEDRRSQSGWKDWV